MNKNLIAALLLGATVLPALQGCFPVIAAGVTGGVLATVDRRSMGTQTEDEVYIGLKGTKLASDVGLKGDARIALNVVAQRLSEGQFPVKQGQVLRPGDKIQFVVNPGAAKFVLIG